MTRDVRVADADELRPGEQKIAVIDGISVGIFNVDGEYYAIENRCAHQHGPVCEGEIRRKLVGRATDPGEFDEVGFSETPTIACPWHGWEYDVRTGGHLGDDVASVRTFETTVEDGTVYVEL